jgi:hypothetical protein
MFLKKVPRDFFILKCPAQKKHLEDLENWLEYCGDRIIMLIRFMHLVIKSMFSLLDAEFIEI